jgi:hypothetical protein
MCYCAHIFNMIVRDDLDELKSNFGCKLVIVMY